MNYSITAKSIAKSEGGVEIKKSQIGFGITPITEDTLPNPAELFLGAMAACILKSVERFSKILNFEYSKTEIHVHAIRIDKPPRMEDIKYELKVYSEDSELKIDLLKKNIEKFGTIFNTVNAACNVTGSVLKV